MCWIYRLLYLFLAIYHIIHAGSLLNKRCMTLSLINCRPVLQQRWYFKRFCWILSSPFTLLLMNALFYLNISNSSLIRLDELNVQSLVAFFFFFCFCKTKVFFFVRRRLVLVLLIIKPRIFSTCCVALENSETRPQSIFRQTWRRPLKFRSRNKHVR